MELAKTGLECDNIGPSGSLVVAVLNSLGPDRSAAPVVVVVVVVAVAVSVAAAAAVVDVARVAIEGVRQLCDLEGG